MFAKLSAEKRSPDDFHAVEKEKRKRKKNMSNSINYHAPWWLDSSDIAFPSAEGFGKYSKGGKPNEGETPNIIYVTNLNDSGNGSLRDALEQEGPRIILFKAGGVISLERRPYNHTKHWKGNYRG